MRLLAAIAVFTLTACEGRFTVSSEPTAQIDEQADESRIEKIRDYTLLARWPDFFGTGHDEYSLFKVDGRLLHLVDGYQWEMAIVECSVSGRRFGAVHVGSNDWFEDAMGAWKRSSTKVESSTPAYNIEVVSWYEEPGDDEEHEVVLAMAERFWPQPESEPAGHWKPEFGTTLMHQLNDEWEYERARDGD